MAVSSPVVRSAARRVAAERRGPVNDPEGDEARVMERLSLLARAVCDGGDARSALRGPGRTELASARRLLDALRAEVVRAWAATSPPGAEEMLQTLVALEETRERLDPEREGRVASTEEMELLVEVAHDLRSPLTSILFLVETLRTGQSGEVNDLQRRQLGLVYSAALGMVSLASNLIELAHDRDLLKESAPAPFSVAEVVGSVCDIVRPLSEEKKLPLRILPLPCDRRVGYAAALSRVLLNLTTNGLKYTETGFVEITARSMGPVRVEFSVRDTGNGLSENARMHLFEPFHRDDESYIFSGTGLGLAICRKLVEAMGSRLQYESAPGWGTRFYFELDLPPASP